MEIFDRARLRTRRRAGAWPLRLKLKFCKSHCSNDIVRPLTSPHPGFLQDVWDSCMLLLSRFSLARAFSWLSSTSCWDTSCKVPGKVCKHFITSEEMSEGTRTFWHFCHIHMVPYTWLQYPTVLGMLADQIKGWETLATLFNIMMICSQKQVCFYHNSAAKDDIPAFLLGP